MTLSVAAGLVELKLLNKRIDKAISNNMFVYFKTGKDIPKGYKNEEEIVSAITSNFDSATALIERRNKIKSAVVYSNAHTHVVIAGKTMTVAEAIERKNSIQYEKEFVYSLKTQFATSLSRVERLNEDVALRADKMVQTFLGSDKSKASEAETLRNNFIDSHKSSIIDPLDIKKAIEKLETDIDSFEAEVDLVLSTSNAITLLELE